MAIRPAMAALVVALVTGCLPYIYHERGKVLIPGIDVDQTLVVAEMDLEKGTAGSVLTLWAMRDQVVTPAQADKVNEIYFEYIDEVDSEDAKLRFFQVWHLTWAISNLYRLGDEDVKAALEEAYVDARARVEALDMKVASLHFHDSEIYMGDAHGGGRAYAQKHLVVPGNKDYLQSVEEYLHPVETDQLPLTAEPSRKDLEVLGTGFDSRRLTDFSL